MPRDFVPCVYDEEAMYEEVSQTWHRRYQVIECFEGVHLATRDRLCIMSCDSHAHHVGVTFSVCAWHALPPDEFARIDRNERARLFDTFYAAMAALE